MFNISAIIAVVILLIVILMERQRVPEKKEPPVSITNSNKVPKGCKGFDELDPEEKKLRLSYTSVDKICQDLFFRDHQIPLAETFLPPKKFEIYKAALATNRCSKAEQLLFKYYKKRYPDSPTVNFDQELGGYRLKWRFDILTEKAPETLFCLAKEMLEINHQKIVEEGLPTFPMEDLRAIWRMDFHNFAERKRRQALMNLLFLMGQDHVPAHIYLIELSLKETFYKFKPVALYLMLKRLEHTQKLPPKWEPLLLATEKKLSDTEVKKLDKRSARPGGFFPLTLPTIPTDIKHE